MEQTMPNLTDAVLVDDETVRRAKFFARWGRVIGILMIVGAMLAVFPSAKLGESLVGVFWAEPAIPPALAPIVLADLTIAKLSGHHAGYGAVFAMLIAVFLVLEIRGYVSPCGRSDDPLLLLYAHYSSLSAPRQTELTNEERRTIEQLHKRPSPRSKLLGLIFSALLLVGVVAFQVYTYEPTEPILQRIREAMPGDPALPDVLGLAGRLRAHGMATNAAGTFAALTAMIPTACIGGWFLNQTTRSKLLLKLLAAYRLGEGLRGPPGSSDQFIDSR